MKHVRSLATLLLLLAASLPGSADQAGSAYKHGVHAEAKNDYDTAYEAYNKAHTLKPKEPKYLVAYVRVRFYAAAEHVHTGQLLRDEGKLAEALTHFQRAAVIDPSNFVAAQEARRTAEMIKKQEHQEAPVRALPESPLAKMAQEVGGPTELKALSTSPINLRMSENVDMIYKVIGKLAGVNVLVDGEYKPQKISIELNDVTPREALDMVALQSKTFWQPISANTIFVAADSTGKRKDLQENVMKTFYLKNVSTTADLQEAASTLKGILDLNRVQLIANQNAMILRGTTDQMILAEKLLDDIDKPKAEVVIDVAVMQVSRDRIRNLGTNPPTSANVTLVPGAGTSGGSSSGSSGGSLTFKTLEHLDGNNFQVSIPGASVTALMSESNTKLLQNPEIRVLDNEKATLKIGDRVPVATGSFQSGIGVGSVNTQFQYLDVGVNIDIVPHIHSENEVTLKMVLEISSVTGTENIGGISQPIIGQRRIEHETRLQDGEVNLVGGILEDSETQSLSGYPWLAKLPILKYFFGQTDKEKRENEIIFAITPHIVRAQDVTEQNLRMVDVGTGNITGIRHKDVHSASAGNPAAGTSQALQNTATSQKKIATDDAKVAPATTRPSAPTNQSKPAAEPKVSGPSPTPTAQQPPPQSKDGAGSTIARAAPPLTSEPRVLSAITVSIDSTFLAPRSPAPLPPNVSRGIPKYAPGAATDPCPDGQHAVEIKEKVVTCAFD